MSIAVKLEVMLRPSWNRILIFRKAIAMRSVPIT
jgi:hypothetical protein